MIVLFFNTLFYWFVVFIPINNIFITLPILYQRLSHLTQVTKKAIKIQLKSDEE